MTTNDTAGFPVELAKTIPCKITRLTAGELQRLEKTLVRNRQPKFHASAYGMQVQQIDPVRGYTQVIAGLVCILGFLFLDSMVHFGGTLYWWYAVALLFLLRLTLKLATRCTLVVEPEKIRILRRRISTTTQTIGFRDIEGISVRKYNFFGWPQCSVIVCRRAPADECVITTHGGGAESCLWIASLLERARETWQSRHGEADPKEMES